MHATESSVNAQPAMATLSPVAAQPAVAMLPRVPALPAVPALQPVAALAAVAMLPRVATLATVPMLCTVATLTLGSSSPSGQDSELGVAITGNSRVHRVERQSRGAEADAGVGGAGAQLGGLSRRAKVGLVQ